MELASIAAAAAAAIPLLGLGAASRRRAVLPRSRLPGLVSPERALTRLYWSAWQGAWERLHDPQLTLIPTTGADDGTALAAQDAKYAAGVLPGQRMPMPRQTPSAPVWAWAEWDIYLVGGDRARLARVLPVVARFHRWMVENHRSADGLYHLDRATPTRVVLSSQMALDAHRLSLMARELECHDDAAAFAAEHAELTQGINRELWAAAGRAYNENGTAETPALAQAWPLLAGVVPPQRADAVIGHLAEWMLRRSPSGEDMTATYVVVRALLAAGRPGLARTVALEHLRALMTEPGATAPHAGVIAAIIEAVLGLSADARTGTLRWTPRVSARHGIQNLRFGDHTVSVRSAARAPGRDYVIRTEADRPFTLQVATDFSQGTAWRGKKSLGPLNAGATAIEVRAGTAEYRIRGEPGPDGFPPGQPQGLAVVRTAQGARLQWQPCVDDDLAGYCVYRTEDHGWRNVSGALCAWSSYTDDDPPPGGCRYAVAAVDAASNTSPMSAPADLGAVGGAPSALTPPESA
ncbi:MAG TPA: hypothetical protein VM221_04020 [Armatimonadota bacterium]|nr:hypothetical protein [Armatimonadota bacterium]